MAPAPDPVPIRVLPDQFDPDPRVQALLDRLTGYYPRAIDPGLERTYRLLEKLGNPHLVLPPVVHVAGTNGKGSTLAFVRAMCEAAGLSCHVMTSPHLVRFNERFVLSGQEIRSDALLSLFEEVERVNGGAETTSFELMTGAGFLEFSRVPADISLIEVGMGGRYDATNVVPNPALTIITSIAKDHTKFLGNSYSAIAREKSGIMKPHVPCVVGPQQSEALAGGVTDVFCEEADEKIVPLYLYGRDWSFDVLPDRIILHALDNIYDLPHPNLIGAHQYANLATASVAALLLDERLQKSISLSAIERGAVSAKWPGRMQRLVSGPLVDFLDLVPSQAEIWIDGGHNNGCAEVIATQIKTWKEQGFDVSVVFGMLNTKDPREFVAPVLPLVQEAYAVTIPDQPLSLTADELAGMVDGVTACGSVGEAVSTIVTSRMSSYPSSSLPVKILITGSLYLMGSVLADHQ